jgi:alpha-L-rhamnosidase
VTHLLHPGANVITAQLSPGWYAGKIAWFGPQHYGKFPHFLTFLRMKDQHSRLTSVITDETWKFSSGPVVAADSYDGETYDARLEDASLDKPGADVSHWKAAVAFELPEAIALTAQVDPPVRVIQELRPVSMQSPVPGTMVYSLAQNITGVCRIKVRGAAGTVVQMRHAEALNADGTLNIETLRNQNLGRALATDHYTLRGHGEEIYQPRFTFHGFQHIEISGLPAPLTADQVTALVMVTDVPEIGQFQCSNALVNRIQSNLHWSGRDAFMTIPMDCPQRSERLGWMGDANFYVQTAAFNFDMSRFYSKWMRDIADGQSKTGMMPNVAPSWLAPGEKGYGYGYGGGWGDAGVGIPYTIWQAYGDTRILRSYYDNMARWIELLKSKSVDLIVPAGLAPAGDWQNMKDDTPHDLIATAFFAHDTALLAQIARVISKDEEAKRYDQLAAAIAQAFTAKYLKSDGVVATGSQTAQVIALYVKLIPAESRADAVKVLIKNIEAHDGHLDTGFVGTRWLLPVLAEEGSADLAYSLLQQTTLPSWGYMISKGATTIWEGWDVIRPDGSIKHGQNSLNHCVFGSVGNWLYRYIGGLQPDPEQAGYRHFFVRPVFGKGVDSAKIIYQAPSGEIAIAWADTKERFELSVRVPCNSTATISLPTRGRSVYKESGKVLAEVPGLMVLATGTKGAQVKVGSGDYRFSVA